MEPSPISRRSAASFDGDGDGDGTTGAHKDDAIILGGCCTPASTTSTFSSCTSVQVVRSTRIEAADRARPTAVPVLQLGAMKAKMEVQSYRMNSCATRMNGANRGARKMQEYLSKADNDQWFVCCMPLYMKPIE